MPTDWPTIGHINLFCSGAIDPRRSLGVAAYDLLFRTHVALRMLVAMEHALVDTRIHGGAGQ